MNKSVLYTARTVVLFITFMSISLFANAHQIRMSVYLDGTAVEGEVYFVGGRNPPGAGASVELIKDDKVLDTVIADEEGLFSFGEISPDSYTVRADGGQGHVAFYELDRSEFLEDEPDSQEAEAASAADVSGGDIQCTPLTLQELQKAITKAIRPLREKIDRYEAKTRLHDILGGIGYILGLFGLLIIVRSRKPQSCQQ